MANTNKEEKGGEGGEQTAKQNQVKGPKGKSCRGYLYYSSTLKSNSRNPRCIGIPRTLQQVPSYVVGQSEVKASKEGRTLVDFYYACAGYSVYTNENGLSTEKEETKTLPVCVGLEVLVDRKVSTSETASASASARVHDREDGREFPQPRTHKPAHSSGDDFMSRFSRNANLVASGVARNLRRVGHYVKESVNDILYPYRRRPK